MDLIVNEVMQLEVVHDTYGYGVIERLTCTSVVQSGLTVYNSDRLSLHKLIDKLHIVAYLRVYLFIILLARLGINGLYEESLTFNVLAGTDITEVVCGFKTLYDILLACAIEHRSHDLPSELLCSNTEVHLKHLTDIHTRRNAQRVKNDIKRSTVSKERHILGRKNAGNDTLITVSTCHLISDGNLSLLCDINANYFIYTCRKMLVSLLV